MIKLSILLVVGLLIDGCQVPSQAEQPRSASNDSIMLTPDTITASVGDCFVFRDSSLQDFGLILSAVERIEATHEYAMVPVKLDLAETGIERIRMGEVYLGGFPDMTVPSGHTSGMKVFHFLNDEEFGLIRKEMELIGHLAMDPAYLNVTGGTIALSAGEMMKTLRAWEILFGADAKLIHVKEIEM